MSTNDRITIIRKQHGLNMAEFAEKTGISVSTIKKWGLAQSPKQPTLGHLQTISKCFDVSLDYLVGNTDEQNSHKSGIDREIEAFEKMKSFAEQEIVKRQQVKKEGK